MVLAWLFELIVCFICFHLVKTHFVFDMRGYRILDWWSAPCVCLGEEPQVNRQEAVQIFNRSVTALLVYMLEKVYVNPSCFLFAFGKINPVKLTHGPCLLFWNQISERVRKATIPKDRKYFDYPQDKSWHLVKKLSIVDHQLSGKSSGRREKTRTEDHSGARRESWMSWGSNTRKKEVLTVKQWNACMSILDVDKTKTYDVDAFGSLYGTGK